MATRWLSWYQIALRDHTFRTNMASGALVMLLGDTIAQNIELRAKRKKQDEDQSICDNNEQMPSGYDPSRAAVMVSWSAVGDVPINLMLFSLINRAMRPFAIPQVASFPQSLLKGICFFVPGVIIRMPCFISYVTSLEHIVQNVKNGLPMSYDWVECVGTINDKMHANLITIFDSGAKLWIPVNTMTFYAVPVLYRPLTLSCITVGWMTYLSLMQHQEEAEK